MSSKEAAPESPLEQAADAAAEPGPHPFAGTFLGAIGPGERDRLLALGVRRAFPVQSALMFEGEPDTRVMLLLSGRVKVTRVDQDGREVLLSIRDPGDVLGELAVIDREPRVASVQALEDVDVSIVPAETFRSYLETTPRVAVALLEVVGRRFREATVKRAQFTASDTMGRLAARITELAERYGERSDDGVHIDSPLSQEELAQWAGASRAGVAQALQAFRELGWVQTGRRELIVRDPDALRARAA
jgi:CRP/FNR family cyclic AMP-dependent transcriptional regulator